MKESHRSVWLLSACPALLMVVALTGCGGPLETAHVRVLFDSGRPGESIRIIDKHTGQSFWLSTAAPLLQFKEGQIGGAQVRPIRVARRFSLDGDSIVIEYAPQSIGHRQVAVRRVLIPPRDAAQLRQYVEFDAKVSSLSSTREQLTLERVTLLDEPMPEPAEFSMPGWQSYPVFTKSFFFGVEFPVATASVKDGRIVLSHAPGRVMNLPASCRSRDAVIGFCAPGRARETFERYVSSFRPRHDTVHFNYNSWWTSPVPFSEADITGLIRTFNEHLYRPFGVPMDSFTIDMGWSARQGIWRIDRALFPNEFSPLTRALAGQKSRLGLWWSPSNHYTPQSFDNIWAHQQGYETQRRSYALIKDYRVCCLGRGTRYQVETREALASIARRFGLGQMKFDGYTYECSESGHGHLPGVLSREATAEGLIDIFNGVRRAAPDIWMETTCFGYDGSPWWLRYVDSVIGPFGDDAPAGAVPAPVYRESYTTSRDFYNLHGSVTPVPIAAQEVLGIVHQTDEPLYNDAVVVVLRGHQFISLYLNPKHLRPDEYRFLAELMKWSRANASLLGRTKVIWPESWREKGAPAVQETQRTQRETYGYAHWDRGQGLICLRNPWIRIDRAEIVLDEVTIGADEPFANYVAVQEYPYGRCLATGLGLGDRLSVEMGPYETKVIRLRPCTDQDRPDPPAAQAGNIKIASAESKAVKTTTQPAPGEAMGDDFTVLTPPEGLRWSADIRGQTVDAGWQAYFLLESTKSPEVIDPAISVNGSPAKVQVLDSAGQWCASGLNAQHGWKWYVADLPRGEWSVSAVLDMPRSEVSASAWLVRAFDVRANRPVAARGREPMLPLPPGYKAQKSVAAIEPTALLKPDMEEITLAAKTGRIPGIYLDRLEPVSASQGWGTLQKNRSVWEKPMRIGSRGFARGIGTHAPATLVYDLGGKYKAFHGFVGQDAATGGTITFEIQVDGEKRWESGRMTRADVAKEFSIPLDGAKTLTIIVTDGGDGIMGDHADLAQVWLEK